MPSGTKLALEQDLVDCNHRAVPRAISLDPDYDGPGPPSMWQKLLWRTAAASEASTYFYKEFFKYNDKLSKMSAQDRGERGRFWEQGQ